MWLFLGGNMDLKNDILDYLGLTTVDLKELTAPLSKLKYGKPSDFKEMDLAKKIIQKAIKNEEKIMIYGDYDCDGIMATSIMYLCLKKLGNIAGYYIPSRSIDGYGITLDRAKQIVDKGYDLLITVDNGVNQKEALTYLHENGVKIIITDHHQFVDLPPHDAILHPFLKEEPMEQCGAYVAYMLSEALLGSRDDLLLSYAAMATISDMMPLKGYNRNIVRLGLNIINEDATHPFHLLYKKEIDEEVMEYQLAPRINAYGRMKEDASISNILDLFISDDLKKIRKLAREIEALNNERKEIIKMADDELDIRSGNGLVLIHNSLKEGLIGLVAARYANSYHKTAMALVLKDDIYKGSIRSIKGAPLDEFFPLVKDLVLSIGGHSFAGGISFKKENLDKIIAIFEEFLKKHPYEQDVINVIPVLKRDITLTNFRFLMSLAPFGKDFPRPIFAILLQRWDCYTFSEHVKATISKNASLIGFNLIDKLGPGENLFIGTLKKDTYHKGNISFVVQDIRY